MKWTLTAMFLGLLVFSACKKENTVSKIPKIEFKNLTDSITEGLDTIKLSFSFEDGDADLSPGSSTNITVTEWKNSDATPKIIPVAFPTLPDAFIDPSKGIKGVAVINLLGANYIIEDSSQTKPDTFRYDVYVTDLKNHVSNTISTDAVLVYPE